MKTKTLYIAALLSLGVAVTAIAKDEPTRPGMAIISTKGSEVVKVIYKGEINGQVKLSITNSAAKIIFSETRNSGDGFILPLNFGGLPFGEYAIELTDASGTKSEKFNFQPAQPSHTVHISRVGDDGKFLLSVSKEGNEDIHVKIYDADNNLVHNTSNQTSGNFAQLYALKNFRGACTFEISSDNGTIKIMSF